MKPKNKYFLALNFGCRVNAAELNQLSQIYLDLGYEQITKKSNITPNLVIINTCAITKKGEYESTSIIKKYLSSKIIVTGCADPKKIPKLPNITHYTNSKKEKKLNQPSINYSHNIKNELASHLKYLLKIQSGCNHFCSYCIVPYRRPYLWSLPIPNAIDSINQAQASGFDEIIITGINLEKYQYNLNILLKNILTKTNIPKISFGSLPLNCIDNEFIEIYQKNISRFSNFLHIPIQSGSDKILKLMNRPYDTKKIIEIFAKLKQLDSPFFKGRYPKGEGFSFGTDIIVGFPTETKKDFQDTFSLCQSIGFKKIHTFRFSPRPNTLARNYFDKSPKINKEILSSRSLQIRHLIK